MRVVKILLLLASAIEAVHCFQPVIGFFPIRRGARIPNGGNQHSYPPTNQTPIVGPIPATSADTPPEPWTKPRLHNNPLVRSAIVLSALALAGLSSPFSKLPSATLGTVHLLSFATWFGTVFYTTFIAGLTMFKALPRQTFGKLQSKLFPKYFGLCSVTIVLQVRSSFILFFKR